MAEQRSLGYVPALDGLRALAVGAVVALHSGVTARGGSLGVTLFFVLSGFLITRLLIAEWDRHRSISLRGFYLRRFLRLSPALVAMIAGYFVLDGLLRVFGHNAPDDLSTQVKAGLMALFYVSDVALGWFRATGGDFTHTWSLGVEEHFYLLWPVVVVASAKRWGIGSLRTVAPVALVLLLAWREIIYAITEDYNRIYVSFDTRFAGIMAGCCLAAWYEPACRFVERRRVMLDAVGLASLALLAYLTFRPFGLVAEARYGIAVTEFASVAVIVWAIWSPSPLVGVLRWGPLVYIGRLSYSIYLWHFPVFHLLTPGRLGVGDSTAHAAKLLTTALLAMASYHLLELPIRHGEWYRRARQPGRTPAPV